MNVIRNTNDSAGLSVEIKQMRSIYRRLVDAQLNSTFYTCPHLSIELICVNGC